jgi:hypothetical protein
LTNEAKKLYQTPSNEPKKKSQIELNQEEIDYVKRKIKEMEFMGELKAPGWDLLD